MMAGQMYHRSFTVTSTITCVLSRYKGSTLTVLKSPVFMRFCLLRSSFSYSAV